MKALKYTVLGVILLIMAGLAVLLIAAMKAPDSFMKEYHEEIAAMGKNKAILSYHDELLGRKTSLDARLSMSDDDSIGMRINLKEKLVYLEIQGIVLHQTPILEQRTSAFFRKLTPAEKYILFHKPLTINKDESSIAKDEFNVVIAPKDTNEYKARQEIVPDTSHTDPVLYRLYLSHGIRIQVIGQLPDTVPQFWPRFRFEYTDRYIFLKNLAGSIINRKPAPYRPTIEIVINSRDAEAYYRAVPKKGKVIVEL